MLLVRQNLFVLALVDLDGTLPLDDRPPAGVAHTRLYLDQAEHRLLAALPATELSKTRTLLPCNGLVLAIDVFLGPLADLVTAEVDLSRPKAGIQDA
jgi:hypothetical protein